MQNTSTFKVYNASAGSGKTYTLVKEYLKVLLKTENMFAFQQVLAITFTNKAAAEMKERVLNRLQDFSENNRSELLGTLSEELALDISVICNRSRKVLQAILQNYTAFHITTIDSFTYKIIKGFAFDLGLSQNFEIEMNSNELLYQAVEVLISKIGTDKQLTNLLIEYALDKTEEDKSWDISWELREFSKVLLNENDAYYFEKLSTKTLEDFVELKTRVYLSQKETVKKIKEIGQEGVTIIETMGLKSTDFYRGTIPKFFTDLKTLDQKFDYLKRSATIAKAIEHNQFYTKSVDDNIKTAIENIKPELIKIFENSQTLYKNFLLYRLTLKSIVPLAVLNQISIALQTIKEENNIQLNAEFNQLISKNIKEQPAPYIYERIGQKFNHYFVDEMQDTSVLQWQNLLPLLANSLAQEDTGLLLVGDGKQAIYRWRGGKAEQFIALGSDRDHGINPFYLTKEVKELAYNYRSYSEVIGFNNSFFKHCAAYINNALYKELFLEKSYQKENSKKGGYVSISFLEQLDVKEDDTIKYAKKVYETIESLEVEFSLSDICVLVRKKREGVIIANYLSEKGIEIVSSETLLIQNSAKVRFIVSFLSYISHPKNDDSLFECLYFLFGHLGLTEDKHHFLKGLVHLDQLTFFEKLGDIYDIKVDLTYFDQLPLYEKMEYVIRSFKLTSSSDAYLQFFLDEVLTQQKKDATIEDFLEFWIREKENLSIVVPTSPNAVQIMTVHKSKGLEFPVIIFPCDLDIYRQINPKIWLDELPRNTFHEFEELYVSFGKEISEISEKGKELYYREQEKLELDNFNLLYVALTRAEEQLYIITEAVTERNLGKNTKYSNFFMNFLLEKGLYDSQLKEYSFGEAYRKSKKSVPDNAFTYQEQYISTPWQDHNIHTLASSSVLWGSKQEIAVDYGNLIHEMMAKIYKNTDVEEVVNLYFKQGVIEATDAASIQEAIEKLVTHEVIAPYFIPDLSVYNEREIITEDQQIVIPDRLVLYPNKDVVIIDYKTGKPRESYQKQLSRYEDVLQSLDYRVVKKILIYINETISVEEI